ncbi:DUF2927 domain-containing protein [Sedimentitalea nanhaiensis]|uniref:ATP-dependent transcriptional regulator n=1 Tax=Sedimentitalea nanhaiensis TaxID=999627 RepID=A0A1I7ALC2_9RHOB|nr:DUF2927 domain-containing protein [Sedimentitalea nanhaiensis]SFT75712.1 Protein of unknown function [Sedimentitalea nanhaiensis]
MIRPALFFLILFLAGCTTAPPPDTPSRAQIATSSLPPMKGFARAHPSAPAQSNANIAADFLDLHFALESGRSLPVFTRFETPILVRVTGQVPSSLQPDLQHLLGRLQREAGIEIQQTASSNANANITIQAVSRAEIRRALPQAACFVVPNVTSLSDYRRKRRGPATNWSLLTTRHQLSIFLPYDSSPQEIRDCLHEELAQAIGPLNDLYRLPDSVFNDDNVHTVLTGFDMLILRVTYAPELYSGMSKSEVATELPDILSRLNPRGDRRPVRAVSSTPRNWIDAVQTALGPGTDPTKRRNAASAAAATAQNLGWQDHRRAFGYYMLGRMTQVNDPALAQRYYNDALGYLRRTPGTQLHQAYIATQTAAYAIALGDGAAALRQIDPYLDVAERSENAALLATLMLLKAEALDQTGQPEAARTVRLDSLGWARYGFGTDWAVRAKMQEIAALNPRAAHKG